MTVEQERLIRVIEAAFKDVQLGEGTGLMEAQRLDDYADSATKARYRESDEKLDWSLIDAAHLDRCSSSLSFFDAAGMRFHLPAFLCTDLRDSLQCCDVTLFLATSIYYLGPSQFELLTPQQREAVREYLWFNLSFNQFLSSSIEAALENYWME